jgi:hypothetical protein
VIGAKPDRKKSRRIGPQRTQETQKRTRKRAVSTSSLLRLFAFFSAEMLFLAACGLRPSGLRRLSPYYKIMISCFLSKLFDGTCCKSPDVKKLEKPQIMSLRAKRGNLPIFADSRRPRDGKDRPRHGLVYVCCSLSLLKSVLICEICGSLVFGCGRRACPERSRTGRAGSSVVQARRRWAEPTLPAHAATREKQPVVGSQ